MISKSEQEFLELPQSKLAIKLSNQSDKNPVSFWEKVWALRTPIIALSAFIAALAPLYQLNIAAIDYANTTRTTNEILERVDGLLLIDATADAQKELLKAKELSPRNVKVQEYQALIDLEAALRERQDLKSLNILEFRFSNVIPSSPRVSYLLGTAYISNDNLDKATNLLNQADRLTQKHSYLLRVQILGAYIWVFSRKFDSDGNSQWHKKATDKYEEALRIVENNKNEDFSRPLISLHHHYSFIMEQKVRNGEKSAELKGRDLSEKVFQLSISTGNHTVIGKAASSLASKLKDSGDTEEALGLIKLAIEHARISNDERGLYNNLYTHGQIVFKQDEFEEAKKSYIESRTLSAKHNDSRLHVFNNINLAMVHASLAEYDLALGSLAQAEFVAKAINDDYGQTQARIIGIFVQLASTGLSDKGFFIKQARLLIKDADILGVPHNLSFWIEALTNYSKAEEFCEQPNHFDFNFEKRILKNLNIPNVIGTVECNSSDGAAVDQ